MEMHQSMSATVTSEEIYHSQNVSLRRCKIRSTRNHKCAYTSQGKVTLESLADAICHLNGTLKIYNYVLM